MGQIGLGRLGSYYSYMKTTQATTFGKKEAKSNKKNFKYCILPMGKISSSTMLTWSDGN